MGVVNVCVHSEQALQDGLGNCDEIARERDTCSVWCVWYVCSVVCAVCGVCSVMFGDGTLDEAVEGMCNEAYNQRTMSPIYGYGVL